ncbi:Alpha-1,3-mannosyl-glycoprotein 2-beta-N-acetylglucosaminyltransferase [Symbiodinium microadriaticum]|uniref:alpha-1,3-mannosyl-glycoprotein 2-beta-N-acetylglucosaminyltransferase n=1 Tax=Symbiodinium microadriaticum TaxID=2951 RepID=A0A1Q9DD92_SYMMI|nr:Alpha-1,3-mannosyl-glycoprotein 2-beta-N-acetylglucosaminyltransferase [Symbiodinium microadriaticum]
MGLQSRPSIAFMTAGTFRQQMLGMTDHAMRGYANKNIIGIEQFGIATPRECMVNCQRQRGICNCWSWKDDGFCRTGSALRCTYTASEDDDRWMFGTCPLRGGQNADAAPPTPAEPAKVQVLMITHKRANYLQRALASIFQQRSDPARFPVIASQDGDDAEVLKTLEEFLRSGRLFKRLQFQPKTFLPTGYERLSHHYGWALGQVFDTFGYQQAIVLEEDLEISPDFFSFFDATRPLLVADPDLFCVSAWSDNGKPDVASNVTAVYRSDFFPGLGWMLLRSFWEEVKDRWPAKYWDDFLRRADVRKGRHCLRPEVSRSHTFGEKGVSYGQFYKEHLAGNVLNEAVVDWKSVALSHVATSAAFDAYLTEQVRHARLVAFDDVSPSLVQTLQDRQALAVLYDDRQWRRVAKRFGLMEDEKEGIRRGTYRGVLPFTWKGRSTFLVRDWPGSFGLFALALSPRYAELEEVTVTRQDAQTWS